jgi:hypothetical protein
MTVEGRSALASVTKVLTVLAVLKLVDERTAEGEDEDVEPKTLAPQAKDKLKASRVDFAIK